MMLQHLVKFLSFKPKVEEQDEDMPEETHIPKQTMPGQPLLNQTDLFDLSLLP
jgi:hypothetical protein